LGFPAIFRGVLDVKAKTVTDEMCIAAAIELAKFAEERGIHEDDIVLRMDERDVFPTVYRANTAGRLRVLLEGAGLEVERLERFETEPEYLAFHPLAYALGVAYERLVNRFETLAGLRVNLLAVARKPGPQA